MMQLSFLVFWVVVAFAVLVGFLFGLGWSYARPLARVWRPAELAIPPRAGVLGAEAVFSSGGAPLPVRKAWGEVPRDELALMFADQFLLRFYWPFFCGPQYIRPAKLGWLSFVNTNSWAREAPLFFEQLTGYKLAGLELDQIIGDVLTRVEQERAPQGREEVSSGARPV